MKPADYDKFIEKCTPALATVLGDMHEPIMQAARAALEEAQDSGTGKAAIKIALSLKWDLSGGRVIPSGSISTAFRVEGEAFELNDDQPELDFDGKTKKEGGDDE